MKNLLSLLLGVALGAVLLGCGSGGSAEDNAQPKPEGIVPSTTTAAPPGPGSGSAPGGAASPGGEGG